MNGPLLTMLSTRVQGVKRLVAPPCAVTCNVITCFDSLNRHYHTFGLGDFDNKDNDVTYIKCSSERELFMKFVEYIEKDYPDIMSGWNSEFFDLPYILNRCTRILGKNGLIEYHLQERFIVEQYVVNLDKNSNVGILKVFH